MKSLPPIPVGAQHTETITVDHTNLASTIGSGLVDVFATPMMIALIELAASCCIAGFLEAGQASVGSHIDVSHSSATPPGMRVSATATVTAVDRRRVDFAVVAADEAGEIGRGTHTRVVIDRERFLQTALQKSAPQTR